MRLVLSLLPLALLACGDPVKQKQEDERYLWDKCHRRMTPAINHADTMLILFGGDGLKWCAEYMSARP